MLAANFVAIINGPPTGNKVRVMRQNLSARLAKEQFGRQARLYAESNVFRADESLAAITEYAALGHYNSAADLGTGAGFTAFALSPYSNRVVATDIAPAMLSQAKRLAEERDLGNVDLMMAEAESLPFADGSLDIVSSRHAAHHFHDLPKAVEEVRRVLTPGALFILSDPIAPEGDYEASWMNDVEVRRDASHQRDLKVSEWSGLLEEAGFDIAHRSIVKVYLEFNDWVGRAATPQAQVGSLRRDFLSAPESVAAAFGISPDGPAINFHWDVLVLRAVKR